MKIIDVEAIYIKEKTIEKRTDSSQDALLIKITTDYGITGWGEVDSCPVVVDSIINAPYSHKLVDGLKNIIVGENPLEIESLWGKRPSSNPVMKTKGNSNPFAECNVIS